jgi:hypothetical protein
MTDKQKTRVLARAIVDAVEKRGSFAKRDGTQAGLAEADVTRLYNTAMIEAHRLDPDVMGKAVQP